MEQKDVMIKNAVVWVRSDVSKKGNPYKYFEAAVNGRTIRLGLCGDREQLALIRAGIDVEVK